MKTKTNENIRTTILSLTAAGLLAACAQPDSGVSHEADQPTADVAVSGAALRIEKAERILDRGGDATEAQGLLDETLVDPQLSDEERVAAVVAQSRAHEALGDREEAIAIVERELASHEGERRYPVDRLRKRLESLLIDEADRPAYVVKGMKPTPPFARMLGSYFPRAEDGAVHIDVYTIGGDHSVHEEVGTFNVGDGLRAQLEAECPLCDVDLNVHSSVHGSDWVMIPRSRKHFDQAMVVLFYDLERNRIPSRYGSLLPMPQAELDQALADGKSLVVAKARNGAPPILLFAAPRAAMLADLERQVAQLDALPTEPHFVEIDNHMRPDEIQAIVREAWLPNLRPCYESLRAGSPEAEGRVVTELVVAGDGTLTRANATTEDASLDVGSFLGCVESTAAKLAFPAIGEETTIRYPLTFNTK